MREEVRRGNLGHRRPARKPSARSKGSVDRAFYSDWWVENARLCVERVAYCPLIKVQLHGLCAFLMPRYPGGAVRKAFRTSLGRSA